MKRMILSATLLLFLAGFANAQTGNGGSSNGSRSTSAASSASQANKGNANGENPNLANKKIVTQQNYKTAKANGVKSSTLEDVEIVTNVGMDNTKEFSYPNGQVSTPTGHEATPTNGGYAALGKNPSDANKGRTTTATTNNSGTANTSTANNTTTRNKSSRE